MYSNSLIKTKSAAFSAFLEQRFHRTVRHISLHKTRTSDLFHNFHHRTSTNPELQTMFPQQCTFSLFTVQIIVIRELNHEMHAV